MTELLLDESIKLFQLLNKRMWEYARARDIQNWTRLEKISSKALRRWERRQDKWEQINDRKNG